MKNNSYKQKENNYIRKYIQIIEKLAREGAEGVILGCTEIPLLIKVGDTSIPVYDTTKIHSDALLKEAIK